ncbi:hypothetical protein FJQ98_10225 [Lysinibacillus agricola]|uniref:Uncharacterized protein n=1 Tax=Lysinibacillus agricola TaxID=2590012 RepID=A0ABX7AWK2_9BACI|nr:MULTISPECIES: hypothetical protein [Lysinibacillus]QQP14352.1 hypothetical protein FJQ98_10225 [Lysinibacillus agricola]
MPHLVEAVGRKGEMLNRFSKIDGKLAKEYPEIIKDQDVAYCLLDLN